MWLSIPNVYAECTNPGIYIDKKFYETKIVSMMNVVFFLKYTHAMIWIEKICPIFKVK